MTNNSNEQGKVLTISGTNWFGYELRKVTNFGVSLHQENDIAAADTFNKKKESVAIIDALILFILIRCW